MFLCKLHFEYDLVIPFDKDIIDSELYVPFFTFI